MEHASIKTEPEQSRPDPSSRNGPPVSFPAVGSKRKRVNEIYQDDMARAELIAVEKGYIDRTCHTTNRLSPPDNTERARLAYWHHLIFPTATFGQATDSLDRHKEAWSMLLKVLLAYQDKNMEIDNLTDLIPSTSEAASLATVMYLNIGLIRKGSHLRINTGNKFIKYTYSYADSTHHQSPRQIRRPVPAQAPDFGCRVQCVLLLRTCRTYVPRMINEAIERIFETCCDKGSDTDLKRVIQLHKVDFDKLVQQIHDLILKGPSDAQRQQDPVPSLPSPFNRFVHDFFESIVRTLNRIARDKEAMATFVTPAATHVRQWEKHYDPLDKDTKVWGSLRTNIAALAAFARWAGVDLPLPDVEYDLNSFVSALPAQGTDNALLDKVRQVAVTFQDREGTLASMELRDLRDARAQIASQFDTLVRLVKAETKSVDNLALVDEILAIMEDCGITEFVKDIKWSRATILSSSFKDKSSGSRH